MSGETIPATGNRFCCDRLTLATSPASCRETCSGYRRQTESHLKDNKEQLIGQDHTEHHLKDNK